MSTAALTAPDVLVRGALERRAVVDAPLAVALADRTPVVIRWEPCPCWPAFRLAWCVTGALARPIVRYVAVYGAQAVVLTGAPEAFGEVQALAPEIARREDARAVALLFLETVRPMDTEVSLVDPESIVDELSVEAPRVLLGQDGPWPSVLRGLALARLARLARARATSEDGIRQTLIATLMAPADEDPLASLRSLPAEALDPDERERLRLRRAALFPPGPDVGLDLLAVDGFVPFEGGVPTGSWPARSGGAGAGSSAGSSPAEPDRPCPFGAEAATLDAFGPALAAALSGARLPMTRWSGRRGTFTALVRVGRSAGLVQLRLDASGGPRARWTWLS